MKRLAIFILGALLSLVRADAVWAITVVPRDFDQLVARADTVFEGTVTAKRSEWTGQDANRHIVTFVTFRVEETYKGASATEQTLRFLGGTIGTEVLDVPEMPRFEVGQTAVLFVVGNNRQFCPLVGVTQGRFHVVKDEATGCRRVFTDDGSPVVNTAEIGRVDAAGVPLLQRRAHTSAQAMAAEDFRTEILGKVAALPR